MCLCVKSSFCSAFMHYVLIKTVSEQAFSASRMTPAIVKKSSRNEDLLAISLSDLGLFI